MNKPVRAGLIGCGAMGRGLLYQTTLHPEVGCAAISDIEPARCTAFLERLGLPHETVHDADGLLRAVERGRIAVTGRSELLCESPALNAVIEATNTVLDGGRYAVAALEHGKHLILMNSEVDLIFGPRLAQLAREHNVICTSCDGDQYGTIKHLVDDLRGWGFELVMAGNIKGFLDRRATPASIIAEADKRNLDYRMCTSYTDGTKLNIEMAITANAFGLSVPVPGMHGPAAAHVSEALKRFDFDRLWNRQTPFVDYLLGAEPGGGVFAVGHCDHPYQRDMLAYYKMGAGPYYLFYRPYHLCHIEALAPAADAVLRGTAFLRPDCGFRANVYTYAKQDLKKGTVLDGIGGFHTYGLAENCADQLDAPGLPVCLSEHAVLKRDLRRDEKITLDDVQTDPDRFDFALYAQAVRASEQAGA